MAMDRAERIGLGTAIGGHALLLGAFALGAFFTADRITKPQPISVSLVGEVADVSTAPDPVLEEPAPAESVAEPAPAEPEPTPVMKVEKVPDKPLPKAVDKPTPKPAPKPTPKPVEKKVAAQPKATPKQTAQPKQSAPKPFSKSFEDAVRGVGSNPKPTQGTSPKQGTVARKAGAEVRREVNARLGPQIQERVRRCAPTGLEVDQIITSVALELEPSGRLSNVTFKGQTGLTETNRPQAEPLRDCILRSIRAASPFSGLDPEYHDVWKNHAMRIKGRG